MHRVRQFLGPPTIVFLVLWAGLLFAGRERMLRDPGTYWHVAAGEKMLASGSVLRTDPFSYSMQGQSWIAQQWLAECFMAILHRLAGLDLLLLAAVTLIAALFSFLAARLLRSGCRLSVTFLFVVIIIGASSFHFLVRPHLATMILMGLFQIILMDVEAGRSAPHKLLLLPCLLVLWTNFHGGALGGLAVMISVVSIWLAAPHIPIMRRYVNEPAGAPLLGLVLALGAVAILINPYGAQLPAAWIALMRSAVLPQVIIEHAPLKLASFEGLMISTLAMFYLAILIKAAKEEFRVSWLVPLFWLLMAYGRVRHGPLFAISAGFCIADMLPHARPRVFFHDAVRHFFRPLEEFSLRPLYVPAALVLFSTILQLANMSVPIIGGDWARVPGDAGSLPALAALRREVKTMDNPRVFNEMRYGGLMIYEVPQARVFIDDRCELHGDQGLKRYVELVSNPVLFRGQADYDQLGLALISRNSRLDRHLAGQSDWHCVYADAIASLYRRY